MTHSFAKRQEARRMLASGETKATVSRAVGVSRQTLDVWLTEGFDIRPRGLSPDKVRIIMDLWRSGHNLPHIATLVGASTTAVWTKVQKHTSLEDHRARNGAKARAKARREVSKTICWARSLSLKP